MFSLMSGPSDKIFISLLAVDTPLLSSLCEEDLDSLKTLMTKSARVLWMTRGGVKDGLCVPNKAAAIGFFRTIRLEMPRLGLFSLVFSLEMNIAKADAGGLVVKLFNNSSARTRTPSWSMNTQKPTALSSSLA